MYKEWMTADYTKQINYKPEGRRNMGNHKRDGKMIAGRKEQAKGTKAYS